MHSKNGILVNEEFISPLRFKQVLVNSITNQNKFMFELTLKKYNPKNLLDARDCRGASLLHIAAEYNNEEAVKYLIRLGLDVNLQNERGQTPLMIALKKQNFAIAKVLLENKADIFSNDTFGMNALRIILTTDPSTSYDLDDCVKWQRDYWSIVAIILDKVDDELSLDSEKVADYLMQMHCPLTHVIFIKNPEVLNTMIKKGSPIDAKECYSGKSALHLATQLWKLDKVKILLNFGADINSTDYYMKTPVMCIYDNIEFLRMMPPCELELMQLLLSEKNKLSKLSDHDLVNQMYPIFKYGSKAAVLAAINKSKEDVFLARNQDGFTLLHVIAENSNPGMVDLIKGRKIDKNGISRYGQTALAHALQYKNSSIIEYLLSGSAIVSVGWANEYSMRRSFRSINEDKSCPITTELRYMKIILEYGIDQEIFTRNITCTECIFKSAFTDENFASAEPVLAQLAIRKSMEVDIPEIVHQCIQSEIQFKNHYDSCVKELQEAKTSVLFKSISVFEFLTASKKMISIYARNRNFIINLSKSIIQLKLSSYYMELVQKRSLKILKMAELREKAEKIICQNIGMLYENNDIVTRLIVDYLDDEDIEKLF